MPTRWTLILAARDEASSGAALADLCAIYWRPLYAYVRRCGHDPDEAQDLTQEFFARLLAKDFLVDVAREKGRFRSFLLASLKHFLANERDRARTLKRGGGAPVVSFDAASAETRFRMEPADTLTPDKLFDRQWALAILDQVLLRLREEFTANGKAGLFDSLKSCLTGEAERYAEIAATNGMSEGAVKVAVHRLRKRYRELLRDEIAQTVAVPEEIDEEIRNLFAAFR